MRELFITDIHSQFTKFQNLLKSASYDKDQDLLILGGDYFDRGPEAYEMARWLEENYDSPNIVLLRGNHDLALIRLLEGDLSIDAYMEIEFMCKHNGLDTTLKGLIGQDYYDMNYREMADLLNRRYPRLLSAFESSKYYHETKNAIYTHASLPTDYQSRFKSTWDKKVWANSFDWANSRKWKARTDVNKPVYIGHYSLSNLKEWDGRSPVEINGVYFCDGAMGWNGPGIVNIIDRG